MASIRKYSATRRHSYINLPNDVTFSEGKVNVTSDELTRSHKLRSRGVSATTTENENGDQCEQETAHPSTCVQDLLFGDIPWTPRYPPDGAPLLENCPSSSSVLSVVNRQVSRSTELDTMYSCNLPPKSPFCRNPTPVPVSYQAMTDPKLQCPLPKLSHTKPSTHDPTDSSLSDPTRSYSHQTTVEGTQSDDVAFDAPPSLRDQATSTNWSSESSVSLPQYTVATTQPNFNSTHVSLTAARPLRSTPQWIPPAVTQVRSELLESTPRARSRSIKHHSSSAMTWNGFMARTKHESSTSRDAIRLQSCAQVLDGSRIPTEVLINHLSVSDRYTSCALGRARSKLDGSNVVMLEASAPCVSDGRSTVSSIRHKDVMSNVHDISNSNGVLSESTMPMSCFKERFFHRDGKLDSSLTCRAGVMLPSSMTQSAYLPPVDSEAVIHEAASYRQHRHGKSGIFRSHSRKVPAHGAVADLKCNYAFETGNHPTLRDAYQRSYSERIPLQLDHSSDSYGGIKSRWNSSKRMTTSTFVDKEAEPSVSTTVPWTVHDWQSHYSFATNSSDLHCSVSSVMSERLDHQPWFHPCLSRLGAERILKSSPKGSFLVRQAETASSALSLSVRRENDVLHMKISRDPHSGFYVLGEYSQPYATITAMIHRYTYNLLPVRGTTPILLRFPASRLNDSQPAKG